MSPDEQAKAEWEKALPKPPNDDRRPLLRLMLLLLAVILSFIGYVGHVLGWWGNPEAKISGVGAATPYQEQMVLIDSYYTVTASLRRSRDIAYNLGYTQGRIDEMTEILGEIKN